MQKSAVLRYSRIKVFSTTAREGGKEVRRRRQGLVAGQRHENVAIRRQVHDVPRARQVTRNLSRSLDSAQLQELIAILVCLGDQTTGLCLTLGDDDLGKLLLLGLLDHVGLADGHLLSDLLLLDGLHVVLAELDVRLNKRNQPPVRLQIIACVFSRVQQCSTYDRNIIKQQTELSSTLDECLSNVERDLHEPPQRVNVMKGSERLWERAG